jgi:hypothetical protein
MATRRSREAALSDLVAGLLDARLDPATDRFDSELAAAEQDGRIDGQTAKVLRWWQRESQRALVEHARVVLPPTLLALEQAASGAGREVEASAASWARAAADEPDDGGGTPPGGPRGRSTATSGGRTTTVPLREEPGTGESEDADDTADDTDDTSDDTESVLTPPADLSEHRRRLLVAGLTRVRTS